MSRTSAVLAAVVASLFVAGAAEQAGAKPKAEADKGGKPISFLTCPIVRDTKTVPCWLAEYEGELYYLGIQVDIGAPWFPPQLGHDVLVEGRISDEPRICGGVVIKPRKTSVMPELNPACNTMWPAEERYTVPFAPRGPGPSEKGFSAQGFPTPPQPTPPFIEKAFTVYYDFDSDYLLGREFRSVQAAVDYALASKAKRIDVIGYRATSRLSNGGKLIERQDLAEVRAKAVGDWLRTAGVPMTTEVKVEWKAKPERANGEDDFLRRRVKILVTP